MKRILCVLLSALMCITMFSGCVSEPDPLRVLVDADGADWEVNSCKGIMEEFLKSVEAMGGPGNVELEVLPALGDAREAAIDRIRTEIMSGGGPDVFIVRSDHGENPRELLFPIAEKALYNGFFLPLDEYIENAQFMEWDKHTKAIMDAGRNEHGQQIIPLMYTVPLTFYRESDIPGVKPGVETTWQDMIEDECGVLSAAAAWDRRVFEEFHYIHAATHYIEYILGDFADYENDELLFSEEELIERTVEVLEMGKAYEQKAFTDIPHYQTTMRIGYDYDVQYGQSTGFWIDTRANSDPYNGIRYKDAQTMIPIYSDDGGVTATVSAFAAINGNTKYAEDAFFILDLLLSPMYQQNFDLYDEFFVSTEPGIPVHEDLMQKAYPIRKIFFITDENYKEYSRVREQITRVYFRGDMMEVFDEMYSQCWHADEKGKDIVPIISEYYKRLKQMMAE